MAELQITDGFKEDLNMVESDRILDHILNVVDLLQAAPEMGSRNLPDSIRIAYGSKARNIPVGPFDIITVYNAQADTVSVTGLVHQRMVW